MESRHRIPPLLLERARSMRHLAAPAETKLWSCLRNRQLGGMKFRRQFPIGPFIADFACIEQHVVIELDGDSHALQLKYDAERTKWLENNGYRVIRYFNHDVQHSLDSVLESILLKTIDVRRADMPPHPNPLPRSTGGEGTRKAMP